VVKKNHDSVTDFTIWSVKDMYQIAIYKTKEPNCVVQQQQYALRRITQSFGTEWYEAQATVRILRYVDSCDVVMSGLNKVNCNL
jgi:hypothetical protein